ncbi:MAG TPA: alanine racemase, partial [Chitinophagaceae bacterium]
AAAAEQSAVFSKNDLLVPVYIDLNVGMNRTGIPPGENAVALYRLCNTLPGITITGLHAYDGHLRDTDFQLRKQKCDTAFNEVLLMKEALLKEKLPTPILIAGGSPTFSIHSKRENIECSPGTFVYWDKGYSDLCPEQTFLPAVVLVARVISLPAPGRVCLDLGHKSVAAENEISKRIFFLNADGLMPVGQSEEHLVLETGPGHSYKTGDVLYGLPWHVCPTVALYEKVYAIEKGKVSGEWKNEARDRRITI